MVQLTRKSFGMVRPPGEIPMPGHSSEAERVHRRQQRRALRADGGMGAVERVAIVEGKDRARSLGPHAVEQGLDAGKAAEVGKAGAVGAQTSSAWGAR